MVEPLYTSKVTVREDYIDTVKEVLSSGVFTMGDKTRRFEKAFAEHMGSKHGVACANGTVSIGMILQGLGIKAGDEIIVPSHTTMPTIEPILHLGARPVFVDIDPSMTLDPDLVRSALTDKTRAILPVHIYGMPSDMERLCEIACEKGIPIIEDCAQAHDATVRNKKAGTMGIAGSYSFYPSKNMTVLGEGGMVLTDDDDLAKTMRMLVSHGQDKTYHHALLGCNYRMSEIHAALGLRQLEELDWFIKKRREIAGWYRAGLAGCGAICQDDPEYGTHAYHLFVIRVDAARRDAIMASMKEKGIFCGIHYPIPCHLQPIIKERWTLPLTEKAVEEIISLPMYPLLTRIDVKRVCDALKASL